MLEANPWTGADLFVPEAVRWTVEPADVEALCLPAGRAADDHDAVAGLEGLASDSDLDELESVIHLEPPPLGISVAILHVRHDKRMRVDELKLGDHAFDGHSPAVVVDCRNRMMRMCRRTDEGAQGSDRKHPPFHDAILCDQLAAIRS